MVLALEIIVVLFESVCCSILHAGQDILPAMGEHPCFVAVQVFLLLGHAGIVGVHIKEHRRFQGHDEPRQH
jgi:hypothetical protein